MDSPHSFKVIVLGTTGVGKTCLAVRQCRQQYQADIAPTTGAAYFRSHVIVEDKVVELKIWDTAGQEQFASLVPMYARGSHACVLVAAVDSKASVSELDSWRDRLLDYGEQPPIVVAINKIDLGDTAEVSEDQVREMLADKYEHVFFVSAKSGYFVEEFFACVAKLAREYAIKIHPRRTGMPEEKEKKCC